MGQQRSEETIATGNSMVRRGFVDVSIRFGLAMIHGPVSAILAYVNGQER
jgi:hypothetical protein